MEDIAAEVVEVAREREFEVEPEDVTALPPSHDETGMDEELLLRTSKESVFLRWNLLVKMLRRWLN